MKKNNLFNFHWLLIVLTVTLLTILKNQPAFAVSLTENSSPVPAAAMKLIQFCINPRTGLDNQAVSTVLDYVIEHKSHKEVELPKYQDSTGAYYEFDTRTNFSNFLQYTYSSKVPSALTRPASLRYSIWTDLPGELPKLPSNWKMPGPGDKPVIIYGLQRDCITPDIITGVYYEYGLKRTLILLNHKGKQALISISKQIEISDVGKKGYILGKDDDWSYYYSGEPGSTKAGLGWVKSYIYNFFSVGVYVESGSSLVRCGNFQWIRAGWSGVNFVKPEHVIKGMKRHARNLKTIVESPSVPSPKQLISIYQRLLSLPRIELIKDYTALQNARQSMAVQSGKIKAKDIKKQDSYASTPKEQIVEELMLENLKIFMGKPSLLGKKIFGG
ncbi:MAG: hypothetical protein ABFD50_09645 [Smithella sp.]